MKLTGNEQAYPNVSYAGLTIRQTFAMVTMQGLVSNLPKMSLEDALQAVPAQAVMFADALIEELNRSEE